MTSNKPFSTLQGGNKFSNNQTGSATNRYDQVFDRTGRTDLNRSGSGTDLQKVPNTMRRDNSMTVIPERTGKGMENSGRLGNTSKIEDSTAAPNRPPMHIKGLTDFLRRAYFEKNGIYINKQRGEQEQLKNFWKEHISESYAK